MLSSSLNFNNLDRHKDYQNIYYNVDIVNARTQSNGNADPIASFSETRDTPIVSDASRYKMSIIRFTMNGIKDLPLFIPIIEADQPDRNKTIYKITLSSGTFSVSQNVVYAPESSTLELSPQSSDNQNFTDPYYYVHTYSHMVSLVNETLASITQQLSTAAGKAFIAPVMVYNTSSKSFDFYIPTGSKGDYDIYFDRNTYNLFSNFPSVRNLENDDLAYKIQKTYPLGLNEVTLQGDTYVKLQQEYNSIGTFWSPIESIVFTSNLLPIVSEGVAPTSIYGKSNISTPVSSSTNFEPIITDIALTLDDAYNYKEFISYIPTSQYRYVSLTNSQQAIKSINVNIFWKCRYNGQLIPLRMSNLSNISLKFLFEKK